MSDDIDALLRRKALELVKTKLKETTPPPRNS